MVNQKIPKIFKKVKKKEGDFMGQFRAEIWMLFLVGVVAAVGLILLTQNPTSDSNSSENYVGEALTIKKVNITNSSSYAIGSNCRDSDGGEDSYTKGTTRGEKLNDFSSGVQTYTDSCETSSFYLTNFCESDDCVKENYCETDEDILQGSQERTGAVSWNWYDCDNALGYTCNDGACVYDPGDLTISYAQIAVYRSTQTAIVNVIVDNDGAVEIAVNNYEMTLEQVYEDGTMIQSDTEFGEDTTPIAPGSSQTISLEFSIDDDWMVFFETWDDDEIMNLQVLLDIDDESTEVDEGNNEYTAEMSESDGEIIEAAE